MALKFYGSRQDLEKIIDQAGLRGDWEEITVDKARFRFHNGVILNWRLTAKTIKFQGRKDTRCKVENHILPLP